VIVKLVTKPDEIKPLPEFWSRWFSISKKARCVIPLDHVLKGVLSGQWNLWVAFKPSGEVIGTLVRRWIYEVHVGPAQWPQAGLVDYFCIHPAYRKKGLARYMLTLLHNSTPGPIPPHFFLLEGLQLSIPPLLTGFLYSYQRSTHKTSITSAHLVENIDEQRSIWSLIRKGAHVSSSFTKSNETTVWKTKSGSVVVQDTFHKSVPEGYSIGLVLGSTSPQALQDFAQAQNHPWGVLLLPQSSPFTSSLSSEWSLDSPFQWIGYNVRHSSIQLQWPVFLL
jgi:GNAT superfamily N-acetyltransferase